MATRDEIWEALKQIANALLDERVAQQVDIEITQMGGEDQMFGFISLNAGLTETKYDEVREIVDGLGGNLIVIDSDDKRHNLRIWPSKVAS